MIVYVLVTSVGGYMTSNQSEVKERERERMEIIGGK